MMRAALSGRCELRAVRPNGLRRHLCAGNNLILDAGLDMIADRSDWLDCCRVGIGQTPSAPSDQALESPVAFSTNRVAASSSASNEAPWNGRSQITYKFLPGEVVGLISEVGIGPPAGSEGGDCFARFLTKDALGQVTQVEVLPDESLEVIYQLSVFALAEDTRGVAEVDGVERPYTLRAAYASTAEHWAPYNAPQYLSSNQAVRAIFQGGGSHVALGAGGLGAITSDIQGARHSLDVSNASYVPGSFERVATADVVHAGLGFPIKSMTARFNAGGGGGGKSLGVYQLEFDDPIESEGATVLRLLLKMSWGRA